MNKLFLLAIIALLLSGCMSMHQTTLDGIQEEAEAQPYVEAYIEYAGPLNKWSGPSTFTVHVLAQSSGPAKISISPRILRPIESKPTMAKNRTLASTKSEITAEMAREQLTHLATALNSPEQGFRGCMYPVRVRLIKADGSVLEKQGCRGQQGWTQAVSEAANNFITASIYGVRSN